MLRMYGAAGSKVAWLVFVVSHVCTLGCVEGELPTSLESISNACVTDDDCEEGTCVASVCSAPSTQFGSLLIEVVPPPANKNFLGARYYRALVVDDASYDTKFTLAPPLTVSGEIALSLADPTCRPSPVEVTFVPVETYLGIDTVRYSTVSRVGTTIVNKKHVDTHTYQLPGVPPGNYDVFIRDAGLVDNTDTPACEVVPELQRGIMLVGGPGTTRLVFNIVQQAARGLRVVVPSREWRGWRVDVVHAKSKELLSSRSTLALPEGSTNDEVQANLRLATTGPDSNQMLLRLRPPSGQAAPSVSMVLSGLEVFEVGQALVPRMQPLQQLVNYQAWVWRSLEGGGSVPGKVHFEATELASVPLGVTASYEAWATIGPQGLVSQQLPPGKYNVRVSPQPGSGFSSTTSEVTVWPPSEELPGDVQGGHVLRVNQAVKLDGTLHAFGQRPPIGTRVRLLSIGAWPSVTGAGIERPFRGDPLPVNVSKLVTSRDFELAPVDCGDCSAEAPAAMYNLEVVPTEQSGFPRIVMPGLAIRGSTPLAELELDVPKVVTGSVVVNAPNQEARPFPGVLVRVYALLSASGTPFIYDVPNCWEPPGSPTCASAAIEVASTYTGMAGEFRLLLPQGFTLPTTLSNGDSGL